MNKNTARKWAQRMERGIAMLEEGKIGWVRGTMIRTDTRNIDSLEELSNGEPIIGVCALGAIEVAAEDLDRLERTDLELEVLEIYHHLYPMGSGLEEYNDRNAKNRRDVVRRLKRVLKEFKRREGIA